MPTKPDIRGQITDAKGSLKTVMQENLSWIVNDYIQKVMTKYKSLVPSQRYSSVAGLIPSGVVAYKQEMLTAMAVVAQDAIDQARKEVPKAKNVRLAEWDDEAVRLGAFDKLPPAVRGRLNLQASTIIDKQISDLVGAVNFQFQHSVDATDSDTQTESDLQNAGDDFVDGASIDAGSGVAAGDIINTARSAFFFDSDVLEQIDGFQFTNGDPVSEICTALAGTVFDKNDPDIDRYQPPLHFGCKSYMVPILSGNMQDFLDNADQDEPGLEKPLTKTQLKDMQFSELRMGCGCVARP